MNAPVNVPQRNRAIKKLLQGLYGGVNISVKAGRGTAYHWICIEFMRMPEELRSFKNGLERSNFVEAKIEQAGIFIHGYTGDGDYSGKCVEIKFRGDHT